MSCERINKQIELLNSQLDSVKETVKSFTESLETDIAEIVKECNKESDLPKSPIEVGSLNDYAKKYSLGVFGSKIDNKLILISLICSFSLKFIAKNPDKTVLDCIIMLSDYDKQINDEFKESELEYYKRLSIVCESFMEGISEGNTFGIKNAKDLKTKVKELLDLRTPF